MQNIVMTQTCQTFSKIEFSCHPLSAIAVHSLATILIADVAEPNTKPYYMYIEDIILGKCVICIK